MFIQHIHVDSSRGGCTCRHYRLGVTRDGIITTMKRSRACESIPTSIDWSVSVVCHTSVPKIRDSACETMHGGTHPTRRRMCHGGVMNVWWCGVCLATVLALYLKVDATGHFFFSGFFVFRVPVSLRFFTDFHSCLGSWSEHFRLVCDLESSLRAGHAHTDRPPS